MNSLHLREASTTEDVPLTADQARWLAGRGHAQVAAALRPGRTTGCFDVTAGNVVGAVSAHGLDVVVEPKLPVGSLMWLVGYAAAGLRIEPGAEMATAPWVEAMAELFAGVAEEATRPGLLRGYWQVDEQETTLRGRIRMADQIAHHHGRLHPLELTRDEFGTDIAANRIVRAALQVLADALAVPGSVRPGSPVPARIRRALRAFDGVTVLSRGAPLPAWRRSRLNERYHHLLELCELVLGGQGLDPRAGDVSTRGLLLDLATVFEAAVARALRESCQDVVVDAQRSDAYVTGVPRFQLRPDVVLSRAGEVLTVLDTKYKRAQPSAGDMQQMITYATFHRVRDVHLVYAEPLGQDRAQQLPITGTGVVVHLHGIDLAGAPEDFLARVGGLAAAVAQGATVPSRQDGPSTGTRAAVSLHEP